nr:hypothetical protein [Mycoplasmopsis bovis]
MSDVSFVKYLPPRSVFITNLTSGKSLVLESLFFKSLNLLPNKSKKSVSNLVFKKPLLIHPLVIDISLSQLLAISSFFSSITVFW